MPLGTTYSTSIDSSIWHLKCTSKTAVLKGCRITADVLSTFYLRRHNLLNFGMLTINHLALKKFKDLEKIDNFLFIKKYVKK